MKNIIIFSLIFFLISNVYSIENNEKIRLPRIPIYSKESNLAFGKDNLFHHVYNSNNAFYKYKVNHINTKYKKKYSEPLGKNIVLWSFVGASCGFFIDFSIAAGEAERSGEAPEIGKYLKYTFTAIGSLLGITLATHFTKHREIPYQDEYNLDVVKNMNLLDSQNFKVPYNENINTEILKDFFVKFVKSDKTLSSYNQIKLLVNDYNTKTDYSEINSIYKSKLSKLFKPKDEFETSQQYKQRIKREKILETEIRTEHEQELKIAEEKDRIKKLELLKQIKEKIIDIKFTKSFNFELSNYDADNQSFTFYISGTKKEVIVPLMRAPKFKENISDYVVQKTFRPTLHGTWETVNDDYVLVNTKTDEIIPWEGKIPTIVEKSVENPPQLVSSVDLIDSNGNGFLDAGENVVLKASLMNNGEGPALKTRISLLQESGSMLYYDVTKTIDEIQPGNNSTVEFSLQVPKSVKDGEVEFKIVFIEEQGFEPEPVYFTAETREMQKPELQIVDFGLDDANGDGKISKGETSDVTVRIQNIGFGKAKSVSVNFNNNPLENVFIISDKSFEIGNLKSGDTKDITFTISTNNRVNNIVNIQVNISEERPQFSIKDKIVLEIEKTQKHLEPIVFKGSVEDKEIIYANDLSIDIEQNIPQVSKQNKNRIAVIFGIEDYKNVSNVTFAQRDAIFVKEYLVKTLGIKENSIYFATNSDVTKAEFNKVFSSGGWLDKRLKADETEIYFYFAGHGAPDLEENEAYLIPYDGDPNYASQTGYKLAKIYDNLSELKAKSVTVFLDACFSGANREDEMLLANARPLVMEVNSPVANGITVFSATSPKEISTAWPAKKHGLFSYFLMKAMQGEADKNNDNKLSIKELGEYLETKVSERAGFLDREQTPQMITDNENRILINY